MSINVSANAGREYFHNKTNIQIHALNRHYFIFFILGIPTLSIMFMIIGLIALIRNCDYIIKINI